MNHNDAGRIDLISTHAPAGGATRFRPNGNGCRKLFLLTPLREGRRPRPSAPPACSVFLLTPLREGRRPLNLLPARDCRFLLTPLREGRPTPSASLWRPPPYFYSRPCGRGDNFTAAPVLHGRISTHAPAGGATPFGRIAVFIIFVFLLTPLREGRLGGMAGPIMLGVFLLTPLREGRQQFSTSPS